jgi:hypothetical protein
MADVVWKEGNKNNVIINAGTEKKPVRLGQNYSM